jgi:hypothetical protein
MTDSLWEVRTLPDGLALVCPTPAHLRTRVETTQ